MLGRIVGAGWCPLRAIMTDYVFHPLSRSDLPLIGAWLHVPHVRAAFGDPDEWMTEISANLSSSWVRHFRADLDLSPAGFVQFYDTSLAPHGTWSAQPRGSFGIDFFLGDAALLNQGNGTRLLRQFGAFVAHATRATRLILDPDPSNLPSIRAAQSAGFIRDPSNGLWVKEIASGGRSRSP